MKSDTQKKCNARDNPYSGFHFSAEKKSVARCILAKATQNYLNSHFK